MSYCSSDVCSSVLDRVHRRSRACAPHRDDRACRRCRSRRRLRHHRPPPRSTPPTRRMTMRLSRIPERRSTFLAGAAIGLALTFATNAQASGTGMPWEQPLQQVLESVQGPVAKIVAVIIIIVTGLTLAFGETAGGFRRLIQ